MKTYNVSPYFDDFNSENDFHQIMFKPGYAVQARELTQLQTILRDQVEKFGNHIFKHGSVVIPGNSLSDLAVPYVKVEAQYNNVNIVLSNFENKVVVGLTTGVKAVVKKVVPASGVDPIIFYLSYVSGSTTEVNGVTTNNIIFADGEELYVETSTGVRATVASANATGVGSLAYINKGVYYVNGSFVGVAAQSVVLEKYASNPSCHVLLKINEEIVDAIADTNLLDNAQGSYNYAAPGADRVKISLELTTLPLGSTLTEDYVEIMRYNDGVLEEHAKTPKYSELEKSLARRTYDESGNYVVNGLNPSIREHLKEYNNGGLYEAPTGDISKMVFDISPGKAYVGGFEVEKLANTRILIDKARTQSHIKNTTVNLRPEYGQYLIVSNLDGGTTGFTKQTINLYNDNDASNAAATLLGTAKIIGVDYLDAGESQPNMYKLWITDLQIGTNLLEDVGGIRFASGGAFAYVLNEYTIPVNAGGFTSGETITHSSGRTATVRYYNALTSTVYAYKHSHTVKSPKVGDSVTGGSSGTVATVTNRRVLVSTANQGLVFRLPKSIPASIKDPSTNAYNLRYTVQKQLTMAIVGGAGSVSISSGTLDAIEQGTFVAIGPDGVISNSVFSISGNSIIATGSPQNGTIVIYANVTKEDVFPKTKTIQTHTETITTTSNNITLSKTDIISVTSVTDSAADITANYRLNNGQTDYEYGYGVLELRDGRSKHTGSSVTVTYTYYAHSGTGDFFCVDSYSAIPNFLDNPSIYKSESSTSVYDLSACLDFRPSVASASYDLLVSETPFNTTLQYYVPRVDSLVVSSAGKVNVISGVPSETPLPPVIPAGQFELNRFYIPQYTRTASSVQIIRLDVERFTMKDIKGIVKRVGRIEDFATLTASELLTVKYDVKDAETGLNRYKTGYLVENFRKPLTIANATSTDHTTTFIGDTLQAPQEKLNCKLMLQETQTDYVIKNGFLMLPYTEEVFANQPLCSRVTNLNPFLVISWNGVLNVNPPSDTWVEMIDLPTVYNTVTEEVIVNVWVDPPPQPTYRIAPSANRFNEGTTITFTVNTTNVPDGTTLFYTITGDLHTNDFTDGTLSGTVTINNNVGTFTKTLTADSITEGQEVFQVDLKTGSTSGTLVAGTADIIAIDSSTFNIPAPVTIVQEVPVWRDPPEPVVERPMDWGWDPRPEPQPVVTTTSQWVTVDTTFGGLYGSILDRAGETGGVEWWSNNAQNGATADDLVQFFLNSPEYNARTGDGSLPPISLGEVDVSAITSTTTTQVLVTSTFVDGQLQSQSNGPTQVITTGVDIQGNSFTRTF